MATLQILIVMKYLQNSDNSIVEQIQFGKRLALSAEKCELLKINRKCNGENLTVNNEKIKLVNVAKYSGDSFNPILLGGGGQNTSPSCFSSTILKRLKVSG